MIARPCRRATSSRSWGRAAAARARCSTCSAPSTCRASGTVSCLEGQRHGARSTTARARALRLTRVGFVFQRFFLAAHADRVRERAAADARGPRRAKRSARRARASCSSTSGSARRMITGRRSSRAARCSASRSRARSRTGRASCSPTSRRASSTRPTGEAIARLLARLSRRGPDDRARDAQSRARRAGASHAAPARRAHRRGECRDGATLAARARGTCGPLRRGARAVPASASRSRSAS